MLQLLEYDNPPVIDLQKHDAPNTEKACILPPSLMLVLQEHLVGMIFAIYTWLICQLQALYHQLQVDAIFT